MTTTNKKRVYITTSIAYTNAPPHIGYALELIQADVLARYHRQRGNEVYFLTGTDEHGAKIARAAKNEGTTPKQFVDTITKRYKALLKTIKCSNDDFIRTSDKKRHWPSVYAAWNTLKAQGDIYKKTYQGYYCEGCEAFLTTKELEDGKCVIHNKQVSFIEEENYFFRLSNYETSIASMIENDGIKIVPEARKKEFTQFVKRGLQDVSLSRPKESVSWGIPVPDDPTQTIYVWGEALMNYFSALGYGDAKKSEKNMMRMWWPPSVQCIGKDIARFHVIIWPALLLALRLPLPKTMLIHGFITVNGEKMAKSIGNVVDPFAVVAHYGTDAFRYYVLREIAAQEDGDYTEEKMKARYQGDLAHGLGNFTARVLKLAENAGGETKEKAQNADERTTEMIQETKQKMEEKMEQFSFHEALTELWALIRFGDQYLNETKPWDTGDTHAIGQAVIIVRAVAEMVEPFLPESAEKMKKGIAALKGKRTRKMPPLFPQLA